MKKLAFVLISVLLCVAANAQMRWNSKYQSYIDQYKDLAIEEMIRYRVPASITLAQGLLESGAGTSELTLRGNNHLASSVMGGQGERSIMTMTFLRSVSAPTTTHYRVLRTIASSYATGNATAVSSTFLLPIIKDGLTA